MHTETERVDINIHTNKRELVHKKPSATVSNPKEEISETGSNPNQER